MIPLWFMFLIGIFGIQVSHLVVPLYRSMRDVEGPQNCQGGSHTDREVNTVLYPLDRTHNLVKHTNQTQNYFARLGVQRARPCYLLYPGNGTDHSTAPDINTWNGTTRKLMSLHSGVLDSPRLSIKKGHYHHAQNIHNKVTRSILKR